MSEYVRSACPHDCPSACALEVERLSPSRIGKVRGAKGYDYTDGAVCAKVARYAERVHHADRLTVPLRRIGAKGSGEFERISWNAALDAVAEALLLAEQRHGSESVWPYHSGGTMGIVQRWGLERLRHVKRYSGEKTTICTGPSDPGWRAGVGRLMGTNPREMASSDLIVVWGGNPVSTQVNAMRHIQRARRERGARFVVIDCYRTPTVKNADWGVLVRPGTDGALACAMMCVMLQEGLADRDYLMRYTDFDEQVEAHLLTRTPEWAATHTGVDADEIRRLARLFGSTKRTFLRLGFGFTRSRNGASNMHAVSALPAMSGAWQYEGGGALFANLDNWGLDTTLAHGLDAKDPDIRVLDQSRIGPILCGDERALMNGPPVAALFMQNANSANVAPDTTVVRKGLTRDDLFVCVHEQFMTSTAKCADIVLPAAMSFEYDDIYMGFGHTALTFGPRILDRHAECWTNHEVICALAKRVGAEHAGFDMDARELVDRTLHDSGYGGIDAISEDGYIDCSPDFEAGHFLNGFPNETGRFRFQADWQSLGPFAEGMPSLPDHWDVIEHTDDEHPFRLITPPARMFLNTSFTQSPSSRRHEHEPKALLHPHDADALGIADGDRVSIGNNRGSVTVTSSRFDGVNRGVVVVEGVWPNDDFAAGKGINHLVSAEPVAPAGGVPFHDNAVFVRPERTSS